MNPQEVLLIGGMGYVGRQLQRPLLKAGYRVHVLDKTAPERRGEEAIEFHEGLLSDESILKEVLDRCGTLFYLASDSVPTSTAKYPALEGELNLLPFLKFLDIFQNYHGVHLVYLSSGGTIYGNPEKIPVDESSPVAPISYHGAGKAAIEAFLHVCSSQFDNQITILRPSNLYGPDQPYVVGFGIIRTMLEKLKRDEPVEIWGDGEVVRDYLYIDDFLAACLSCMQAGSQQQRFRIFNVSAGRSLSINQLCDVIEEATRRRLKKRFLPGRAIDVKSVILDCSRIKTELSWQPVVEMSEGIKRTWEWIKKMVQ
ncbi:MAG: NAD-dependent epimerase/dehydratase family protein [Desulfobacter postgatei]|uniref:NAD-dependent epimerase/dehydratase family protein n=1 Tax=Desulfobacter postgatei TaxID=2293 RepID=UPI0023F36856|nr:NAD-dependent epimerase/dehydratase family protein [Desulfobacter postgatei]MDD4275315.1 NAD-dependent epimerase/dehydratase family protein [Desulfobacter postgatei]